MDVGLHVQAAPRRRVALLGKEAGLQRPCCACCGSIGHCSSAPKARCYAEDRMRPLCILVGAHAVRAERRVAAVPVQNLRARGRPHCRRALNACIQRLPSHTDTTQMAHIHRRTVQLSKEGELQLRHSISTPDSGLGKTDLLLKSAGLSDTDLVPKGLSHPSTGPLPPAGCLWETCTSAMRHAPPTLR